MIEYCGRHDCKQCFRGKSIRFGYKVWCLNTPDGYLSTFGIYQGKNLRRKQWNEKAYGKCGAIVLKNIESLPEEKRQFPYNIYFDNIFTSFPLMKKLKDNGHSATGTIRENRCKKCPLKLVNVMKKEPRGTTEFVADQENKIMVC